MGQVTVTIDGRDYKIACEDGREAHIQGLARYVDERVSEMVGAAGQSGDSRILVMASLLLADESDEIRKELAELRARRQEESAGESRAESSAAEAIEALAKRIETIATRLEQS